MVSKVPAEATTEMPFDEWRDALHGLMPKAQGGSAQAKQQLARLLKSAPDEVRLLNWDKSVRTHLLEAATRDTDPSRHMIPYRIEEMRKQLTGDASSPVEKLLIERILTCWTHVFVAEMRWVAKSGQDIGVQAGDYYQRALDRAHRRYLSALKALAQVRKLLAPSVGMLNVVQNQNVTLTGTDDGASTTPEPESIAAP